VHREVRGTVWRARQVGEAIELDVDGDEALAEADLRARLAEHLPWQPVVELAAREERVADLVARRPTYRPPITPDPYEATITAITAQQVNLAWATTTRTRLVHRFGRRRRIGDTDVWAFPAPAEVAAVDPAELRGMQFTTRKAEYIVGVSRAADHGHFDDLTTMGNEEVVRHLTELRGLGRWTAEQVLARSLARPDAVAAGDLGVRKAVSFLWHASDELLDEATVRSTAEAWGDATNWVVHLLLEDLSEGVGSRP